MYRKGFLSDTVAPLIKITHSIYHIVSQQTDPIAGQHKI